MSTGDRRRYVISYDIVDNRRRNRVSRILRAFGDRVQYSVFMADVSASACVRIERRLREVIDSTEDSVIIFDLGPARGRSEHRAHALGRPRPLDESRIIVI